MNEIEVLTRYSHEYTDDTLRCKLCDSLKAILLASQEATKRSNGEMMSLDLTNIGSTIHFNDALLRFNLLKIDWKNICSNFDTLCVQRNSSSCVSRATMKSTTLDILLDSFRNPTIWPSACIPSTFRLLIEVIFVRNSSHTDTKSVVDDRSGPVLCLKNSEFKPSQNRILNFLTDVLQRNQWMQNIDFWVKDKTTWLLKGISTYHQGEIVLRILRLWVVKLPHCMLVWISLLSKLVAALDIAEAFLVQILQENEAKTEIASRGKVAMQQQHNTSNDNNWRKRPIQQSSFDFQNLHGEGPSVHLHTENIQKSQSLHVASSDYFSVIQDTRRQANSIANDMLRLWQVKALSVNFLVTCSRRVALSWVTRKPIFFQSDPMVAILHELLETLCTHPSAITLRLSCILVAKAVAASSDRGDSSIDKLLSTVWSRATCASNIAEVENMVIFFCELIIVCSRYDDKECLIKALTPLLAILNDNVDAQLQSPRSKKTSEHGLYQRCDAMQQIYRQTFALILTWRGSILMSSLPLQGSSQHAEQLKALEGFFINLVTKLSLLFEQPKDWIDKCCRDQILIIKGLQLVGILSFDFTADKDITEKTNHLLTKPAFPWISEHYFVCLLKQNFQNMIPWLLEDLKLALPFFKSMISNSVKENADSPRIDKHASRASKKCQTSILDLLQEDLFLHIFSFLNYKRLARMRLVCIEWKSAADKQSLWYSYYLKRYKNCIEITNQTIKNEANLDWKFLFINRHQAERAIRHISNKKFPKWRIRLCGHLNCLYVIKSSQSMQKHKEKHLKIYIYSR